MSRVDEPERTLSLNKVVDIGKGRRLMGGIEGEETL